MEGKKLFDYESSENKEHQEEKPNVNVFLKVIQIILSIILGAMHV
ncbi:hypothetical protein PQ459_10475 [Chryseobacterium sp. KACC 21268]|nr:hypothetical protein PQ459_10475 [Chryseobacterium sp. KACC 21268]